MSSRLHELHKRSTQGTFEEERIQESERSMKRYECTATLGEYIISKRKELGISQRELARRAGLQNSTISRIENNLAIGDLETIVKLADGLNISISEMMQDISSFIRGSFNRLEIGK